MEFTCTSALQRCQKEEKLPLLWNAVHRSHIGLTQESHGNETAIQQFFFKVDSTHVFHWSGGETADKGGVVITLRKDLLEEDTLLHFDVLAPCRIFRSVITYPCNKSLAISKVHWYDITKQQSSEF
eukprot:479889-Karenia_brevis.AAC.1